MNFDISLEAFQNDSISIRFYSEQRVELHVKRVKLLHKNGTIEEDFAEAVILVNLDNNYKQKTFNGFRHSITEYFKMYFLVEDKTNFASYSVEITLQDRSVGFKTI